MNHSNGFPGWRAICAALIPMALAVPHANAASPQAAAVVNAHPLNDEELRTLHRFGIRVQPGRYWYDRVSGAWGVERGPTAGFIAAGLQLGGTLRTDASGGGTGVFINGRELHPHDVVALSQFVHVIPGRWWVNAQGFFGPEGGPEWGNLWLLAQQRLGSRSPWSGYSSDGRQFLGFDSDGNGYFQGSNPVGGPTVW
jgi:hypothetical protein